MNWTEILRRAGIPEPPGRQEAIEAALERRREKEAAAPKKDANKWGRPSQPNPPT
jgi:hypothetical protein